MNKISFYGLLTGSLAFMALPHRGHSQNVQSAPGIAPKLFQVTTAATQPGDAVLVRGEYLDKVMKIAVCRLTDDNVDNLLPNYVPLPREDGALDHGGTNRRVEGLMGSKVIITDKLLQNTQSVKFIVPSGWKDGVYSVRLTDASNATTGFYINVPQVNWVISEEGLQAVAGGYLRIQGKNLLRKGVTGQAILISADSRQVIRVKVAHAFDDFSVRVNMPANMPAGNYHMYYHNGLGGKTAWSEPLKISVVKKSSNKWDQQTFNVKDYGAKGDGLNNETAAFRAALAAAEEHGGGTVYVPRGRYQLTGELILSPFTLLKGESKELTQLFWSPLNWDTGEMPNSLISGTHHFGIKDLHIWATRAWGIILSTGPVAEQGNITLENLIVRQSAQIGGIMYAVKAYRDTVDAEFNSRWTKTGIVLRGQNLKIRYCDFNSSGMYTFAAASGFIQHCRFERSTTGINQPYMIIHPKGLIFEDCYKQADGYGYAATIDESHDLYEARNTIPFDYTNDREVMTLDGGGGGYAGNIGSVRGTTITLPAGAKTYGWTANKWIGGGVFIVEGKGAGQFRRIVSHTLDSILLDQPFLVNPDSTSVISISTIRQHLFFVNNDVTDGGAYQFYGSAQNCVVAGLKMRRSNGIISRGSFLYRGRQPNWYIDIVDCELREGNYCHWFGAGDQHSGYQSINLIGTGGAGMNIGTLIRRNKLYDFTYIRTSPGANAHAVTDVIIEDNYINTAKNAILLGGSGNSTSNVLIHNNHYRDVDKQVDTNTGLKPGSYLIKDDGISLVK